MTVQGATGLGLQHGGPVSWPSAPFPTSVVLTRASAPRAPGGLLHTARWGPHSQFLGWSLECASLTSSPVLLLLLVPLCPHGQMTRALKNTALDLCYLKYVPRTCGIGVKWNLLEIQSRVPCQTD